MKKELQDIADKENLDVHFMGYCNQDTVIEFYALSDFFYYQYGICRMYSKENPQYFRLPVSGLYP